MKQRAVHHSTALFRSMKWIGREFVIKFRKWLRVLRMSISLITQLFKDDIFRILEKHCVVVAETIQKYISLHGWHIWIKRNFHLMIRLMILKLRM